MEGGRIARYPSTAVTGQSTSPVRPMYRWTPAPNGSVLLRRSKTASTWGLSLESTLTSATDSVSSVEETLVNSPTRMKPKNPRQHAAQGMTSSNDEGPRDQTACNFRRRSGVMGSLLARECPGVNLRMPFRTYDNRGNDELEGSGRPELI